MKNLKQLLPCLLAAGCLHSHAATTAPATTLVNGAKINFSLSFSSGFDATTSVTPVGGNPATKLGEQRKEVFIAAARYLAAHLASETSIGISLAFDNSLSCTDSEAQLGSAAASAWLKPSELEVNDKLLANTFYPSPLFAALGGSATGAINARFNANLGTADCLPAATWYYGFDAAPVGQISLLQTAVHELSHALGISSLLNTSTGEFTDGIDIYSTKLSNNNGTLLRYMNAADRLTAMTSDTGLLWQGVHANTAAAGGAGLNNGKLMLHATTSGDTAVNHLHSDLSATQLLAANSTAPFNTDLFGLALYMLEDIGWTTAHYSNTVPVLNAIPNEGNLTGEEDTLFKLNLNVSDADTTNGFEKIYYDVKACPNLYTCAFNGNELTITPPANKFESISVKVRISDGHFGYTDKTLAITFNAVNDVPTWNMGKNLNYTGEAGSDKSITLTGVDIEHDDVYFCVANDTSTLTTSTSISGNQVTLHNLLVDGTLTLEIRDVNHCATSDITYNKINLNIDVFSPVVLNTPLTNGVLEAGLTDIALNISGGSDKYTFSATLNGAPVNAVTTTSGATQTYVFSLPKTGAFAGTYTVIVRDAKYGNTTTFTAYRPLRMNFNAQRYMAGSAGTLKVEGGQAGEAITLSASNNLLNPNSGAADPFVAIATTNSSTFNAATFTLQANNLSSASSSDISVSSANADASATREIIPTRSQTLDVAAEDGSTINDASIVLVSNANTTAFDLPLTYSPDNSGHFFSFALPDDGQTYSARVSAAGYVTSNVDFNDGEAATQKLLRKVSLPMTIALRIKAATALVAAGSTVTLILDNGDSRLLAISAVNGELSVSETLDLNTETPKSIQISVVGMQSQSISIDSGVNSLNRTITLEATPDVLQERDPLEGSSLHWCMLLLALPLLTRRKRIATR